MDGNRFDVMRYDEFIVWFDSRIVGRAIVWKKNCSSKAKQRNSNANAHSTTPKDAEYTQFVIREQWFRSQWKTLIYESLNFVLLAFYF